MSRTRIVFFVVVLAAVIIVAGSFVVRWLGQQEGGVTSPSTETLEVRIVCALPVEPWVREAAKQFNQEKHTLEGQPIKVSVIPMDGLTAMGRYEREEMDPLPTVATATGMAMEPPRITSANSFVAAVVSPERAMSSFGRR